VPAATGHAGRRWYISVESTSALDDNVLGERIELGEDHTAKAEVGNCTCAGVRMRFYRELERFKLTWNAERTWI
jgi:hypothetical protein